MKLHYAGEIRTARMHVLPGWAACCSGARADAIRAAGAATSVRSAVTCLRCLAVLRRVAGASRSEYA